MIYQEVIKITREYRDVFDIQIAGSWPFLYLSAKIWSMTLRAYSICHSGCTGHTMDLLPQTVWCNSPNDYGDISTIWSLGLMSLLGVEMTLIATVIPVLLVAVGSAWNSYNDSLLEEFSKRASDGKNLSEKEHEELLGTTMHGR